VAVDEVGRVRLVRSARLLHPEEQAVQEMLAGWRNQQLSRNLQIATVDQRVRFVRRFLESVNEYPWRWTPSLVDEYFGDQRSIRRVAHSTLRAHQAALRHFLNRPTGSLGYGAETKHSGGVILNCSSVHEIIPKPGYIAYSISKGGMENMTRTLALEYADKGIRVNAVAPGAVNTDMNARWINDPKMRHDVESHIPMGRAAASDEMASVFAFLASDDASYITGQTLFACGGLTLFGDFKKNWSS